MKLEYLNKHHLMRMWSTPEGLNALAEKTHDKVKAAFPARYIGLLTDSVDFR